MILITGVSGFIGRHLLDALIRSYGDQNVVALTSKPINSVRYLLHNGYDFNKKIFVEVGFDNIDTIIHVGAFTPKTNTENSDLGKCNSNIINTYSLLTTEHPNLKKIIFLSTLDVYDYSNIITEESIINPVSLYGHSKLYCEKLISAWAQQNQKSYQILRIGHVYGPGEENYQKVIPITMSRIINGETVQIYGDGKEIRSFIFITDVVESIISAINLDGCSSIINIVGHEQISISELIHKIVGIANMSSKIEIVNSMTKQRDLIFNNKKMIKLLHEPKVNLDVGLLQEWKYMLNILK